MNALENLHDGPTMSTSISNYISTYIRTNEYSTQAEQVDWEI